MTRLSLLIPLSFTLACNKDGDKAVDDTGGDDGSSTSYEPGCITVNGSGGYAWLNDAIAVATDGSSIELCAEAAHEEEVIVDKVVHIVGPGPENFLLVAPTNATGITVTAAGASLSGVSVSSTRNGVVIEEADGVSLEDIEILAAGNWGLKVTDSEGVTVTGATLNGNAYGGLQVDGGSAVVTDSTFSSNVSYGIQVTGGGSAEVSGSEISLTNPDDAGEGGFGFYANNGGAIVSSGNQLISNGFLNAYGDEGDLTMEGDVLSGALYGIAVVYGAVKLTDIEIDDAFYIGAYIISRDEVIINGFTSHADPDATQDQDYDAWGGEFDVGGSGLVVIAEEGTLENIDLAGWNNCGILLSDIDSEGAPFSLSNATIDGVGRHGLLLEYADATLNEVNISGLRNVDPNDENQCYYVNYTNAVYALYSTANWTGGSISTSEGWGFVSLYSSLNVSDAVFDSNQCAPVLNYIGSLVAEGNTFTGTLNNGGGYIQSQDSTGDLITANSFLDTAIGEEGEFSVTYDYSDYGYIYTSTYTGYFPNAFGIYISGSTGAVISGNTFSNTGNGIYVYYADAEILENEFIDMEGTPLTAYGAQGDEPTVTLSDNTVTGWKGDGFDCTYANLEISDTAMTAGTALSYGVSYLYEFTDGSTSSGSYTSTNTGWAINGYACSFLVDGVTISDMDGFAIYDYAYATGDYTVEVNDLTVEQVGKSSSAYYGAFASYAYVGDISWYLNDVKVDDTGAQPAFYLYAAPANGGSSSLTGSSVEINGTGTYGLYMYELEEATLEDLTVTGSGQAGVYAYRTPLSLSYSTLTGNGNGGISANYGSLSLKNSTVSSNTGLGVQITDSLDYDKDGYSLADGDCDDTSSSRHPGAYESTNYLDDDCDGIADDGTDTSDADGDGYTIAAGDCNDLNAYIYPGGTDFAWRVDGDCDGVASRGAGDTLVVTDNTIANNTGTGLSITSIEGTVTGNTITGNGTYGMSCAGDWVLDTCDTNTVSGNTVGDISVCPDTCGT